MSQFHFNRESIEARDVASDRASMEQRIESFRHQEPTGSVPLIVNESVAKSPPGETRIPELDADKLTVADMRTALAEHGALIVRNMFPKSEMDALIDAIDQVLAVCDSPRDERVRHSSAYYNPPGNLVSIMPDKGMELGSLRMFNSASGGAMCVEAPVIAESLLQFYEEHGLKDLIGGYLGESPCLSVKKWMLRRSMLPIQQAGWHQDGAFMGTDINSINLWIPLTECGGETGAPGMDVVPKRLYQVASAEGATFDWTVSDELVRGGAFECQPVAPVFNAGDAFFFDHLYLHRTQFREQITKVRYAVETWFFGATTFPKSQVPIAW